jgi:hypothetical protein
MYNASANVELVKQKERKIDKSQRGPIRTIKTHQDNKDP